MKIKMKESKGCMDKRERELLTNDMMEMMVDGETRKIGSTDSPRVWTMEEIRAGLEARFNQYDKDVRQFAPEPTQAEVDECLAALLDDETDRTIERAGAAVRLVHNDIEVQTITGAIRKGLGIVK